MNFLFFFFCYIEHQKIKNISEILQNNDTVQRLQMSGMSGSQEAFILAAISQSIDNLNLLVAFDKEDAAYIQNDLTSITSQNKIHFFPDSFNGWSPIQKHFSKWWWLLMC